MSIPSYPETARQVERQHPARRMARRQTPARKGFFTVALIILLVVTIVLLMLVLNWIWMVLNNRDMQRRGDVLALVAISELLDEDLLEDKSGNQVDDETAAKTSVAVFVEKNNSVAGPALRLDSVNNVNVIAGNVPDVTTPAFSKAPPFNSLRVELFRYASGVNPVLLIMRGFGSPDAVDIRTASIATLDSRLTGFRPTSSVSSPVVPIAIESTAWFLKRPADMFDVDFNMRFELDAELLSLSGGGITNAALVDFDGSTPIEVADMPSQMKFGIFPAGFGTPPDDLPADELGPATPGSPLPVPATQSSPLNTANLVMTLNTVAVSGDPRRIFPLYVDPFSDPLNLVGFIAARIVSATNVGSVADPQLSVKIEPEFIVHFTATTDPAEVENTYIHKLRLVQ